MPKRSGKRERRSDGDEFRRNVISRVEDRGYTNAKAARELGISRPGVSARQCL